MEIPVSCSCGKSFKAKPALAGKTVACPGCKEPISIPTESVGAPAVPDPPAPAAPAPQTPQQAEILVTCGCSQQFKVDAQFAGQQVNCPTCQSLCVIPSPGQPQSAFSQPIQPVAPQTPMPVQPLPPQPAAPQQMVQQPLQPMAPQQPMTPQQPMQPLPPQQPMQPMAPQQSAFDSVGYGQPDYGQSSYSGGGYGAAYGKPTYKTGLGIFLFAIAACVFAGGYGLETINMIIAKIGTWTENYGIIDSTMIKIGGVAKMLGLITMVVGSVFMMLSPKPLFGLGIALISTSACSAFFSMYFEVMPWAGFYSGFYLYDGRSIYIMTLLVTNATLILCSIFLMYALRLKRQRYGENNPMVALYALSIGTGLYVIYVCMAGVSIRSLILEGQTMLMIFADFIHLTGMAGMIVGLVFLIKALFEAKRMYKM